MERAATTDRITREDRVPHHRYAAVAERTAPRGSYSMRLPVPSDRHTGGPVHNVAVSNIPGASRTQLYSGRLVPGDVPAADGRPEGWIATALESMSNALAARDWEYAEMLVGQLKAMFDAGAIGIPARKLGPAGTPEPLLEPLRARELEVIALVAEGHSNQEIAERLIVSVGTIRWHLKNIYSKLDVHSRTGAVARARATGLLE